MSQTKIGILILAGVAAIVSGFAYLFVVYLPRYELDRDSLCLVNLPTKRVTVILVDTAFLDRVDIDYIAAAMKSRYEIGEFSRHERVVVYELGRDGVPATALFGKCNPGRAEEANRIFEDPDVIRDKAEKEFISPLVQQLRELHGRTGDRVPIIESLRLLAEERDRFFGGKFEEYRLLIFSSFIQSSEFLSQQEGCRQNYAVYRQSAIASVNPVRFAGMKIEARYLLAEEAGRGFQGNSHYQFWKEFLAESGGQVAPPSRSAIAAGRTDTAVVCTYPSPDELALNLVGVANKAMLACKLGEAGALLQKATAISQAAVKSDGAEARLSGHRKRCDELAAARAREEATRDQSRHPAIPDIPRKIVDFQAVRSPTPGEEPARTLPVPLEEAAPRIKR